MLFIQYRNSLAIASLALSLGLSAASDGRNSARWTLTLTPMAACATDLDNQTCAGYALLEELVLL